MQQLIDISGRPLPADYLGGGTSQFTPTNRVQAVPPANVAPGEGAQPFLWTGYQTLPAGAVVFTGLLDGITNNAFLQSLDTTYRAVISSVFFFVPDMIAGTAPLVFGRVTINDIPAAAWGTVPIFPRAGIASVSFDSTTDLPANCNVKISGMNVDPANTHFLGVYLQGWAWPK